MSFKAESKGRDKITATAAARGWRHEISAGYSDEFVRDVTLDPNHPIAKIARMGAWQPRERIVVSYSSTGAVLETWHGTPAHQSALEGLFVDGEHLRGGLKTAIVILESDPWTPPTQEGRS